MSYWLKTSIWVLISLVGQSQAGLAVEEINQPIQMAVGPEQPDVEQVDPDAPVDPDELDTDEPISCGADGICRVNECAANLDPDCPELPDSSGPTAPEATGNTTETGVSGIRGSVAAGATVLVTGDADSTTHALYGISSKERRDNPCLVTILKEHINDSSKDTTPHKDLCGSNGAKSSEIIASFEDLSVHGKRVFLTGVQVCMNNDKSRVKGLRIRGQKITDAGDLVDLEGGDAVVGQAGGQEVSGGVITEPFNKRFNCDEKEGWMEWAECPANSLATAAVLHFEPGAAPRSLTGTALKCRSIEDMGLLAN